MREDHCITLSVCSLVLIGGGGVDLPRHFPQSEELVLTGLGL